MRFFLNNPQNTFKNNTYCRHSTAEAVVIYLSIYTSKEAQAIKQAYTHHHI